MEITKKAKQQLTASPAIIDLQGIVKRFYIGKPNELEILHGIDLQVQEGQFVSIVGESGSGKSTLMNIIGALDQPTGGQYLLDGECVGNLKDKQLSEIRNQKIGFVFQTYNLIPRTSALANVEMPMLYAGVTRKERTERAKELLELVGMKDRMHHKPDELSGGQKQRVAIARAIVNEPEILLLDEPLGALDYKMRKEMQLELKLMHEQLGITFIFVTHDQEEALTMSDKIVVMSNGEIQQVGTPEEIYDEPKNAFVADFIGESNIFNGVMTGHKKVSFCQTEFDCVDDIKEGLRVQAVIRPEDVVLTEVGKGKLQGEVLSSIFKGTFHEITVLHNEKDEIVAQASGDIAKGTKVGVDILPDSIHLMHFNEKANHFTGMIDDAMRIRLVDGSIKVDMTKLFPGSTLQDGVLYDKSGHPIETEGRKVVVYINPRQAQLSDDPQVGLVQGHIDSLIYMGDHYSYEVRSSNDELYFVYDEYLWNIGDYVSVVVPDTGISVTLAE